MPINYENLYEIIYLSFFPLVYSIFNFFSNFLILDWQPGSVNTHHTLQSKVQRVTHLFITVWAGNYSNNHMYSLLFATLGKAFNPRFSVRLLEKQEWKLITINCMKTTGNRRSQITIHQGRRTRVQHEGKCRAGWVPLSVNIISTSPLMRLMEKIWFNNPCSI